jgi:hypothetical protein
MYIEQALEEAKKITATAKSVGVKPLEEGFVATQYIIFPYDYEIPIAHLYKPSKQELVTEVAERWGLDISIINET